MPGGIGSLITSAPVSPVGSSSPAPSRTRRSQPGTGRVGEPGTTGSRSIPRQLAAIAQPVSVCHQWSITGTRSFSSAQPSVSGSQRSPARKRARKPREVVAADVLALRVLLPDRPERGRCGEQRGHAVLGDRPARRRPRRACRPACPRTAPSCSRATAARRRCRSGRRPSRRRTQPSRPRRARRRRRSSSSRSGRPRGRRCRARFPSPDRSCPTCRGCTAGRWHRRRRNRQARRWRWPRPVEVAAGSSSASSCGRCRMMQRSGFASTSSIAASSSGL